MTTDPAPPNLSVPEIQPIVTSPSDLAPLRGRAHGDAPKTFGEHAHRFVQNILVNHVLNLAISFWFARAADFGGNKLENGVKWLNDGAKRASAKYPSLGIPISIFWLSTGGTVLMPVVRGMDETKVKLSIVKRFDQWRDALRSKKPDEGELLDREAAYARIAQEEHPSWGRTAVARLAGILFNFGTEIALNKAHRTALTVPGADPEKDYGYGWLGKKVIDDFDKAGRPLSKVREPGVAFGPSDVEGRGEWWARTIPLEVLSTVNAVAFYNLVYRWFQKDGSRKKEDAAKPREEALPLPVTIDHVANDEEKSAIAQRYLARPVRAEARASSYAEQATRERITASEASPHY